MRDGGKRELSVVKLVSFQKSEPKSTKSTLAEELKL